MRCKECNFEQAMTDQEWYDYGHAHCGIEVGDKVKVLRKAKDHEKGWDTVWCWNMDRSIGRILTVRSINRRGFQFEPDSYRFPFFVLELIEKAKPEPEPESPLPQSILDVIDNEYFGCAKKSIERLVAEILKQR